MNYYWVWDVIQTVWATENYVEKKYAHLESFLKKMTDAVLYFIKISRKRDKHFFVCYLNFFFCEYKTKNSESASYAEIAVWKKKEKNKQPKAKNTQQ